MSVELFMDVDASGSEKDPDAFPIRIAVAGPNDGAWMWCICPLEDWNHWDQAAEDDHGLSRDFLIAEGQDPYILSRVLNRLFRGKVVLVISESQKSLVEQLFNVIQVKMAFDLVTLEQTYDSETVQNIHDELLEATFTRVAEEDVKILYRIIQSWAS